MKQIILGVIFFWVNVTGIFANGEPVSITRLTTPITLDGIVDEPQWLAIEPLPMVMHTPTFEGELTQRTEIRLAFDDDYLYISGRMYDDDAQEIMANSKKRDAQTASTEWFGFAVDSYNDKQNALTFFTTPTGLRQDGAVENDAVGSNPVNFNWNNFWDAAVSQDENGWYAEIRVPFSTLPFQLANGKVIMGITVMRYIARNSEFQIHPAIPPDFGDFSAYKPSLMQEYVMDGLQAKKPFYITPYVLTGLESTNTLNDNETEYVPEQEPVFEAGLDLKYGITNNWTLDLSVNTDFAQVEADDQQVNLTRFNLFFPEKRLFFQERAGIFNYNFGRTDRLFYSRRIGIYDGTPIRIYGGVRVVGRSGPWDVGFLSMQTESIDTVHSQNHAVFRVKRRIIDENSDVGFILTNQTDFKGNYNTTFGFDANIRLFGEDFLSLRWAQTIENGKENQLVSLDPTKFWISMSRRTQKGFSYGVSFSRRGIDYNPVLGFEVRENFTRVGTRIQYTWFEGASSRLFSHGVFIRGATHWGNETMGLESMQYKSGYQFTFKNRAAITLNITQQVENLDEEFELSDDIVIPVANYLFWGGQISANSPITNPLFVVGQVSVGQFYDGRKFTFQIEPTWSVSPSLELSTFYQYNDIAFDVRNEFLKIHLARIKGLVMISTKFSISAFLQYNSLDKIYAGNVRLRYNPREGRDLYIVYNDNLNIDLERDFPIRPRSNARTFLIKYSHTFTL